MELTAHPAMAADARLRRPPSGPSSGGAEGHELRVVAQATFLLVSGLTEIVAAEELDEEAARWLQMGAAPDGASVVVLGGGAGASRVTASEQVVRLGPEGRGDRPLPRDALCAGAALAVETEDAGTVAMNLPAEGPSAWLEVAGVKRQLALHPFSLRIDLVGLRLSIAWCAAAQVEASAVEGSRLVVHTDASPSDAAPRSTRPPAPARSVAVVDGATDGPRQAPRPAVRPAVPPEWDVDSTVSIEGTAPPSLPLPFVGLEAPAPTDPDATPMHTARSRAGKPAGGEAALGAAGAVSPFALLHVEAGVAARLRRAPEWRTPLQVPSRAAERAAELAGENETAARDAHDAVAALRLARALPLARVAGEVAGAVDDGLFVPPLLVVEGELELPLDAPGADAVDAEGERRLRRERRHVMSLVHGGPHAVGVLASTGGDGARSVVLIPRAAVDRLPIARRFRVRLLVEAHPPHEPDVSDEPSLIAIAIARDLGES